MEEIQESLLTEEIKKACKGQPVNMWPTYNSDPQDMIVVSHKLNEYETEADKEWDSKREEYKFIRKVEVVLGDYIVGKYNSDLSYYEDKVNEDVESKLNSRIAILFIEEECHPDTVVGQQYYVLVGNFEEYCYWGM